MRKRSFSIAHEDEKPCSSLANLSDLIQRKDEVINLCKAHHFSTVIVYYRDDIGYDEEEISETLDPVRLFIADDNQPYLGGANRKILVDRQIVLRQELEKFFSCNFDLTINKLPKTYPQCSLSDLNEEKAIHIFPYSVDMNAINHTFAQCDIKCEATAKNKKIDYPHSTVENSSFGQSINMYGKAESKLPTSLALLEKTSPKA